MLLHMIPKIANSARSHANIHTDGNNGNIIYFDSLLLPSLQQQ